MTMTPKKAATRQQIIQAAQILFASEGFKQTGMTDIAEQCDMSPANLYRFFANKAEIGEAVVQAHIEFSRALSEQVENSQASAQDKLKAFVIGTLQYNFKVFHGKTHLLELIEFVSQKLSSLPMQHRKVKMGALIAIFAEGQKSGEVRQMEVMEQARLVMLSLRSFLYPQGMIIGGPPLGQLEEDAAKLIDLLFTGLFNN